MRTITFTILLFVAIPAIACINESYSFEEEYQMNTGQSPVEFLREQMDAQPSDKLVGPKNGQVYSADLDAAFVASQHEAVRDIYSGNYNAAIEKLQAIETTHPGHYGTAANIGTAYELAGDNKNALRWISEGIKRNKDSHQGTEWLHKKILEARIAMESNPDYLKASPILPVNDHHTVGPTMELAQSWMKALHFQLGERMLFVKPEDPVVADLLYSFAALEANTQSPGPAIELLKLAREYGYHDTAGLDEKLAQYRKAYAAQEIKQWIKALAGLAVLCVFALLFYSAIRSVVRRLDPILNPAE